MKDKEKTRLAARLLIAPANIDVQSGQVYTREGPWNPEADDGDSRLLEIVCLNWITANPMRMPAAFHRAYDTYRGLRDDCQPVALESCRAAVLDLAAAIGESMGGEHETK